MMSVSLDGFIEGPDREIDWHRVDAELHRHFNEVIRKFGGLLDGRVTHEPMAGFWPTADQDPGSTAEVAEFAAIWRDIPKFVYSRTLERADWNTTIVRDVVPDEVRALKERNSPAGTSASVAPTSRPRSCGTTWSRSSGCTSTRC
jgi:dihydrofolate reductase